MNRILTLILCGCFSTLAFAQNGTIRGKVYDDAFGGELIGVTVVIKGTSNGAITDLEGAFTISIAPGTYDLQVSYISFETITISGVVVEAGKTLVLDNIRLKEEVSELEEVVITAEIIKTSETALLTVKRKSANLMDGISSQNFRRIGDSNAAGAIRRVTGVSVQDGKYVYVRGLGDRYTKSMLNGMDIPGLDPDRNNLQMDIFPTSVLNNIIVFKSFTPDLPADFTGGVINIETKDFPEEKTLNISTGFGFNPDMHFNNNYLTYEGGATDWLGFDDGTRDLNVDKTITTPNPIRRDPLTEEITRSFDPTLGAETQSSSPNFNISVSGGNQYAIGQNFIGFNASVSYRNTTTFFEGVESNSYLKQDDLSNFELQPNRTQSGNLGTNNVLTSGLFGVAFKTEKSKFKLNYLTIQNGESRAGIFGQSTFITGSVSLRKDNLEFTERSIDNVLIGGEHAFPEKGLTVEYAYSPTISKIEDKDVRSTPFRVDEDNPTIEPSESGDPTRIWRNLDETDHVGRVDVTKEYLAFGREAKAKAGLYYTNKERDYEILNYRLALRNVPNALITGEPNELLADELIWTPATDVGTYIFGNFEPSNTYAATQTNFAGYIQTEVNLTDKLKSIVGARVEVYEQLYSGVDQMGDTLTNAEIISDTDFFPSLNLIYALNDKTNLRASFSNTIARPSFKEASIAQIFDPLTGRTFIGGLRPFVLLGETVWDGNIQTTSINNFDLRFEHFLAGGQLYSVSAFYKQFTNPLELVVFSESAPDNFQPRNLGDARVYGVEFEVRRNLGIFSESLSNFTANLNTSLIKSELEMDKSENGEYESRLFNAREGETIDDIRQMQGQAPYLINAGLTYTNEDKGWETGLYYNVQGRRLAIVGIGATPDVYDVPFNSLNLSVERQFGPDRNQQLTFRITNILDDDRTRENDSFGSTNSIYSTQLPGRTFSVRYRVSIF